VALDGTKIHANASRHSALSYEHATKIEAHFGPIRGFRPRQQFGHFGLQLGSMAPGGIGAP
jgi:hypothetical protein